MDWHSSSSVEGLRQSETYMPPNTPLRRLVAWLNAVARQNAFWVFCGMNRLGVLGIAENSTSCYLTMVNTATSYEMAREFQKK